MTRKDASYEFHQDDVEIILDEDTLNESLSFDEGVDLGADTGELAGTDERRAPRSEPTEADG